MHIPNQQKMISHSPNIEVLNRIASLVDQANDHNDLALVDEADRLADYVESCSPQETEQALLDYFRANAWACRYQQRPSYHEKAWDFEQPEIQQQIFFLRRAANSSGFVGLDSVRKCQILTNLGNQLDTIGRFIESQKHWSDALAIDSNFWMASGNQGRALMQYANALYDQGQQCVFAMHAHDKIVKAVKSINKFPNLGDSQLKPTFIKYADQIAKNYNIPHISKKYNPGEWSMGSNSIECSYRQWCLKHILFLNPMNDIEAAPIAAYDVLMLPSFTTKFDESPIIIGMFNELKQSFVSARWILWESIAMQSTHYSDRDVLLYNTLDYPIYGLSIEKTKIAFRMAYSIFDKIAFFLNHYLALGIKPDKVAFRTIWRIKSNKHPSECPIHDNFTNSENWPFRGLFWLSKDLFDKDMKDSTEPDASAMADLRNHLEHKYVKVHQSKLPPAPISHPLHDSLAYSISRFELEKRTQRLMRLVREALIYLSLGVHQEERKRDQSRSDPTVKLSIDLLLDDWKR